MNGLQSMLHPVVSILNGSVMPSQRELSQCHLDTKNLLKVNIENSCFKCDTLQNTEKCNVFTMCDTCKNICIKWEECIMYVFTTLSFNFNILRQPVAISRN